MYAPETYQNLKLIIVSSLHIRIWIFLLFLNTCYFQFLTYMKLLIVIFLFLLFDHVANLDTKQKNQNHKNKKYAKLQHFKPSVQLFLMKNTYISKRDSCWKTYWKNTLAVYSTNCRKQCSIYCPLDIKCTSKCSTPPSHHTHLLTVCMLSRNPAETTNFYMCCESRILVFYPVDILVSLWRMTIAFCSFSTVCQAIHSGRPNAF